MALKIIVRNLKLHTIGMLTVIVYSRSPPIYKRMCVGCDVFGNDNQVLWRILIVKYKNYYYFITRNLKFNLYSEQKSFTAKLITLTSSLLNTQNKLFE